MLNFVSFVAPYWTFWEMSNMYPLFSPLSLFQTGNLFGGSIPTAFGTIAIHKKEENYLSIYHALNSESLASITITIDNN